jgi:hypothetical protein
MSNFLALVVENDPLQRIVLADLLRMKVLKSLSVQAPRPPK